ncbi:MULTISPECIES: hypothetical protein [unclassified Leptolyngbya]|uniref:hypothetical protein n=1 Tax=unclassified Leptolyngbya TaxID=2650499 RepID=UPI001689713A|nr:MULTISPECIES: hypothetical protein [unclassified Leptolyngbya]MBD1910071.1 hypothetical protein [Leptolyngbya sp. FACHB-8]MBD2158744.1 hypothetical protein [Leptolyngbya sp. FACHB-16]
MHPQLESVFDEAENRYLKPEELSVLSQYVSSLPERLDTYRVLRDRELDIMQKVADDLVAAMPGESQPRLERSIRNALLVLRYCAMGMLLEDESFVQGRIQGWLKESIQAYDTPQIETQLYTLLDKHLAQSLSAAQVALLKPLLALAQNTLLGAAEEPLTASVLGW